MDATKKHIGVAHCLFICKKTSKNQTLDLLQLYDLGNLRFVLRIGGKRTFGPTLVSNNVNIDIPLIIENDVELILEGLEKMLFDVQYKIKRVIVKLEK